MGTTQPLVPDVEDLRFTYGVDNDGDGDADAQLAHDAVPHWARIACVHLYLRLRSSEDGLTDLPQPFLDAQGDTVTPGDRRLRRVFTATVSLRQRQP